MVALTEGAQQCPLSVDMLDTGMQDIVSTTTARAGEVLADPAQWALFLDIDGTLIDVAATPDAAIVPRGLAQLLGRVAQGLGGALALSTGRRVAAADRLLSPLKLVTSGVHGTELRSEARGEVTTLAPPVPSRLVQAVSEVTQLATGILVEQKGAGLAVHYRNNPAAGGALAIELGFIVERWDTYELRPGRKVLEIVPRAYSKGTALAWLMQRPPFQGRRPVMIGDDHGDEAALLAAEELGGVGLKVAGEHFVATVADFKGTADVRAWLALLAGQLERQRAKGKAPPVPAGHRVRSGDA
jgi:trehalose 6-phosphate phosphatase